MSDDARKAFVERARKIRAEITQIFDDQDHWNRIHPTHVPLDVDYDGKLRRIAEGLDAWLAKVIAQSGERE